MRLAKLWFAIFAVIFSGCSLALNIWVTYFM